MPRTTAHSETRLACFVHCKTDFRTNPIKARIADAETANIHTRLVIGARDPRQSLCPRRDVISDILLAIKGQ